MKFTATLALMIGMLALPAAAPAEAASRPAISGLDDLGRPISSDKALYAAVYGEWRTADEQSRDKYRHPMESLTFWGLKPGMRILEIQPGQGYWTNILAPYAHLSGGSFYATGADLANPKLSDGSRKARADFEAKYAARPDLYGDVRLLNWGAVTKALPANLFDFILTARSIHGWMRQEPGTVEQTFAAFYSALKPGGILAVEQHRANPGNDVEKPESGYVSEAYVIRQAQKAGFRLVARSEVNANPKDTKDHPFGVWTLPPALRSTPYGSDLPDDPAFDHSKYLAIGESDRMTLKFVKPRQ